MKLKLHVRPMIPPEPEMMSEEDIAYTQLHEQKGKDLVALNEWVHWDPVSGKMLKGPKPAKPKMVPTGSMKAVDLVCNDCGHELVAGNKRAFYFLICGRLAHATIHPTKLKLLPEPSEDTVVECGNIDLAEFDEDPPAALPPDDE